MTSQAFRYNSLFYKESLPGQLKNFSWHIIRRLPGEQLFFYSLKASIMNRKLLIIALAAILTGAAACSVEGGWVDSQPADVTYVRPAAPGEDYIWIDGDWVWSGGAYTWHQGHWERPRTGRVWAGGHWENGAHGYRWHRGHWR
jgi:hypothetical protein